MKKQIKISYLNRQGVTRDIVIEKIVLTNHYIKDISGFQISDKVNVEYIKDSIIISKLT